jgi:hypothetical protein
MDFLSTQVGPLTAGQWLGIVVAGFVLSSFMNMMRRKTASNAAGAKLSAASCLGCGWQGKVSQYHRTCPRCGNSITRLNRREQ